MDKLTTSQPEKRRAGSREERGKRPAPLITRCPTPPFPFPLTEKGAGLLPRPSGRIAYDYTQPTRPSVPQSTLCRGAPASYKEDRRTPGRSSTHRLQPVRT